MIAPTTAAEVQPLGASYWLLVLGLGAAAVGLLLVADGNAAIAALPMLLAAGAWAIWKAPVRKTLCVLAFFALAVEGPVRKDVPLFGPSLDKACQVLLMNLNIVTGIRPLAFTAVDALALFLFVVLLHRRMTGASEGGRIPTAAPLVSCGVATLASTLGLFALGIVRGGDFRNSLWQVHVLLFIPILFLLFQAALRGAEDAKVLARVLIAAALFRAALVLLIAMGSDMPIENAATSHSDSVLFALTCGLLIARWFDAPSRRTFRLCAAVLPIVFAAMVKNNRRLVWVELAAVLLIIYLMSAWSPLKRAIARTLVVLAPVLLIYTAVGWSSSAPVFAPVKMVSSMISSKPDASTVMRDIENYNLLKTLRSAPMLGLGWGHPYLELIRAIDISNIFPQYRFLPHNGLLGLWAFNGAVGFFLLFLLPVAAVFFASRAYRLARSSDERVACLCAICAVACHAIQCFGDIGTSSWTSAFLLAPAIAIAGKLAVSTGAWPMPRSGAHP